MADDGEQNGRKVTAGWFVAFATTFGILTWVAAAGKFVDLVWFVRIFADNWREFFRDLWTAVSNFIRLPYAFTPNQKDCLTIISACLAIGARPSMFGFDAKPLFKSSINMLSIEARRLRPLQFMWRAMFAYLLIALFVTPFIDPDYFQTDVMAVCFSAIFGWWTIASGMTIVTLVRRRFDIVSTYRDFDMLPKVDGADDTFEQDPIYRWLGKPVIFISVVTAPFLLAASFFDAEFRTLVWGYVSSYSITNFVNVVVFFGMFAAMVFACRKSVRPIANIVIIGIVVIFVASSAQQLIDSYERNFPSRPAVERLPP